MLVLKLKSEVRKVDSSRSSVVAMPSNLSVMAGRSLRQSLVQRLPSVHRSLQIETFVTINSIALQRDGPIETDTF